VFNLSQGTAKDSNLRIKTAHQELVQIVFPEDRYESFYNVDLNEINDYVGLLKLHIPKKVGASSQENEDYVSSFLTIPFFDSSKRKSTRKFTTKSNGSEGLSPLDTKYLVYGVKMSKMRKILTIRNPFVIVNQTLFSYHIKILQQGTDLVKDSFILKPEKKFGIDFQYYQNHNLKFKVVNGDINLSES